MSISWNTPKLSKLEINEINSIFDNQLGVEWGYGKEVYIEVRCRRSGGLSMRLTLDQVRQLRDCLDKIVNSS